MTQITDGSSDILPRVLPQPSNFAVRSEHPVIPSSLNLIGGSGPSRCQTTFSHRWMNPQKDGRMIRRWRCNNTGSSANENRVRTLDIFDNLVARLIGVPRFVVSSPGILREGDSASLEEPARPQVFTFSTCCVQECQEADLESEGCVCKASTTHRHHLVCQPVAACRCTFCDIVIFRFFWSAVFSACYILGGIVVESPGCPLAPAALSELERAITFYEEGSTTRIPSTTVSVPCCSTVRLGH